MIFDKGFNKSIDLIKEVDEDLYGLFHRFCLMLPARVKRKTEECEDFVIDNELYNAEMLRTVNSVNLDFITYKKYFRHFIYAHRYFEEDLFKDEVDITLFTLNQRNTQKKKPNLEFYFEEKDNEYKFLGTNDNSQEKTLDLVYNVRLEKREDEFYLISEKLFRGIQLYQKENLVSFDTLMNFVEDEEEYEEELEVEFDLDSNLEDKLNGLFKDFGEEESL